jgi:hypothetical protein
MATAKDIEHQVQRLRDDLTEIGGRTSENELIDAYFLPTKSWALVRKSAADPNIFTIVYGLGDTKGEAEARLLALRQGLWLGFQSTPAPDDL